MYVLTPQCKLGPLVVPESASAYTHSFIVLSDLICKLTRPDVLLIVLDPCQSYSVRSIRRMSQDGHSKPLVVHHGHDVVSARFGTAGPHCSVVSTTHDMSYERTQTAAPQFEWRHHLSEFARNRLPSPLKALQRYWETPGLISLAGGMKRSFRSSYSNNCTNGCRYAKS